MKYVSFLTILFVLLTTSVFAQSREGQDEGLRFQPGVQISPFFTGGGGPDHMGTGFGIQSTLFKVGPLSFGGGGISVVDTELGFRVAPYIELVTIDMSYGPGIMGVSFKYVFRDAFQGGPGESSGHSLGVGAVLGF